MMDETTEFDSGRRAAPDPVWEAVRDDYLAGMSAPDCCRRHGVRLSTLRLRAAREGWRRSDQPWTPQLALDPQDEGRALEERVGGNLTEVRYEQLSFVAQCRMIRAVLRGEATEALRWRRVQAIMDAEAADFARFVEQEEEREFQLNSPPVGSLDGLDALDAVDGVFSTTTPRPSPDQ